MIWKTGTGFDLFASLYVLHHPAQFGLRGAWAKGVRARLDTTARETLEAAQDLLVIPLAWLDALPQPCDGLTVLQALASLPPAERFRRLVLSPSWPEAARTRVEAIMARGAPEADDLESLRAAFAGRKAPSEAMLRAVVTWAVQPARFGERYLAALQSYYRVFFHEEEQRIRPALAQAVMRAQALAEQLPLPALLEELSQGVRFPWADEAREVVLAPSFWMAPLVVWDRLAEGRWMLVFGARPAEASLVPGESVPDTVLRGLEALASPTRLRILRHLLVEPATPSALARRLRLRAPTVIHHLNALRLAGLVYLDITPEGERRYAARPGRLQELWDQLQTFLRGQGS